MVHVDALVVKTLKAEYAEAARDLIDRMGIASAKAQKLLAPITAVCKLVSTAYRMYVACRHKQALGFIKVGVKKLFVRSGTSEGVLCEVSPLCVLDFYVSETCQRQGVGLFLFNSMLEAEDAHPGDLAYDRPSNKFVPFLAKHHALQRLVLQSNNFVVFENFFERSAARELSSTGGRRSVRGRKKRRTAAELSAARAFRIERVAAINALRDRTHPLPAARWSRATPSPPASALLADAAALVQPLVDSGAAQQPLAQRELTRQQHYAQPSAFGISHPTAAAAAAAASAAAPATAAAAAPAAAAPGAFAMPSAPEAHSFDALDSLLGRAAPQPPSRPQLAAASAYGALAHSAQRGGPFAGATSSAHHNAAAMPMELAVMAPSELSRLVGAAPAASSVARHSTRSGGAHNNAAIEYAAAANRALAGGAESSSRWGAPVRFQPQPHRDLPASLLARGRDAGGGDTAAIAAAERENTLGALNTSTLRAAPVDFREGLQAMANAAPDRRANGSSTLQQRGAKWGLTPMGTLIPHYPGGGNGGVAPTGGTPTRAPPRGTGGSRLAQSALRGLGAL